MVTHRANNWQSVARKGETTKWAAPRAPSIDLTKDSQSDDGGDQKPAARRSLRDELIKPLSLDTKPIPEDQVVDLTEEAAAVLTRESKKLDGLRRSLRDIKMAQKQQAAPDGCSSAPQRIVGMADAPSQRSAAGTLRPGATCVPAVFTGPPASPRRKAVKFAPKSVIVSSSKSPPGLKHAAVPCLKQPSKPAFLIAVSPSGPQLAAGSELSKKKSPEAAGTLRSGAACVPAVITGPPSAAQLPRIHHLPRFTQRAAVGPPAGRKKVKFAPIVPSPPRLKPSLKSRLRGQQLTPSAGAPIPPSPAAAAGLYATRASYSARSALRTSAYFPSVHRHLPAKASRPRAKHGLFPPPKYSKDTWTPPRPLQRIPSGRQQVLQDEALARQLAQGPVVGETMDLLADHRREIRTMLERKARCLCITKIEENPHSLVDTPLYNRFVDAWQRVEQQHIELAFHGTPAENVDSICREGLDPKLRKKQKFGPGEYFGKKAKYSYQYCRGGGKMLVMAVITDPSGVTGVNDQIVVVNNPAFHLPLFTLTFAPGYRRKRNSLPDPTYAA